MSGSALDAVRAADPGAMGLVSLRMSLDSRRVQAPIRRRQGEVDLSEIYTAENVKFEVECDALIPAAIENQIGAHNASRLRCRVVVEGANGPTSLEADAILRDRGILVVPDILANAGGVTVSYFEWVQNRQHYRWTLDRVRQELDHTMSEAFENVWQVANQQSVSLRTAAYIIGITRVRRAAELVGFT